MIIENSSQPFLYKINDNIELLYCYADHPVDLFFGNSFSIRPWKIKNYSFNTEQSSELPTQRFHEDFGRVIIEANPSIAHYNNTLKLCWTAGFSNGKNSPIQYYLCSMDIGNTINDLSNFQILEKAHCGAIINGSLIFKLEDDNPEEPLMVKALGSTQASSLSIDNLDLYVVNKITPIFNSDSFIIGGINLENINVSYVIDKEYRVVSQIKNQYNYDVNKCSLYENKLSYSVSVQESKKVVIENIG
jgi:hypothetical protein